MLGSREENMAQFARTRWRLAFLIPSWGGLIAILLGSMGIFAYRLAETLEHYKERDEGGQVPIIEVVWEGTNIAFSVASLIFTILEITKYAAETLTPFFLLSSSVVKITLALAELALDIVVYQMQSDRNYSIVGLALDCGILATTITTFIYAFFTFRRLLKYDDYDVPKDTRHLGQLGMDDAEMGNCVKITSVHSDRTRLRSSSNASAVEDNPGSSYASQTMGVKLQVDQAIGAEFGWSSSKSSPILASGEVHSGKAIPGGPQVRVHSWVSHHADTGTDLESIRLSHDFQRHQSVPTVIVSGQEDEDDSKALLDPAESYHDEMVEEPISNPRYHGRPNAA